MSVKSGSYLTVFALWVITAREIFVTGEQRFEETPALYQEVSSGDDVRLRCRVKDKRGQCVWQKDRKPVGIHPGKYEWASDREGDCSILVKRASLDFDDGQWECQVTPGDFARQDALTSPPARLLVRVSPRKPRLEVEGTVLGSILTLREGQEATLSCVSRYGNPPALIKWYVGGSEVAPLKDQTNATEVDNPKTWAAHSLLRIRGERANHGKPVRCLSIHPTTAVPAVAESKLDVHYSPEVKLETVPRSLAAALEDSESFLSLKCLVDANPPAVVKWYKDSEPVVGFKNSVFPRDNRTNSSIPGMMGLSELPFEPVKRTDKGLYSCKASNTIGESPSAHYRFDVQYGPRATSVNDRRQDGGGPKVEEAVVAVLGSSLDTFECELFDANPSAMYRWVHLRGGTNTEMISNPGDRAGDAGRRLRLENVQWSDEGEYRCVAYNVINGVRREASSDARYVLHVTGPPEIQTGASSAGESADGGDIRSIGWAGEPVHRLRSRFCSRPPPRLVAWQWGSSHIRAGESIPPKYEALPLEPIIENKMVTNCYWAKLEIKDLQKEDARVYTLLVESEKGRDSTNVLLLVRDPMGTRLIAAAAAVGTLFLLGLFAICLYAAFRSKRTDLYSQEVEEGSIAADAFYSPTSTVDRQRIADQSQMQASQDQTKPLANNKETLHESPLAVLYGYDHISKQAAMTRSPMSPEALKVRRAPVVLQAPTIV
ncbi:irregular chiasm C-roughest protein-like [Neodiprion virginianus]|uniref:irregular chiasm C-roughest protein-like n=1 Tax=Neodiprion virginianus TaxID=2961670 RepID=UPI001EE6B5D6|nr:irregular chiasm C-roughest protein-like [Neodiprion virginianus]